MKKMDPASSQDRLLSFPAATFAKLCPLPYLQAHLSRPAKYEREFLRPSGRSPQAVRPALINVGSLNHACGSAVVRAGDTAVVCGVRGEVLLLDDVPNCRVHLTKQTNVESGLSASPLKESTHLTGFGLLVPNIELATGCTPAHLPNNPPSSFAQSLSHRIMSLLSSSNIIQIEDLQILNYERFERPDGDSPEAPKASVPSVCAYWTLYIDILFISLDGNAFDIAWTAVVAALHNTRLPMARFDPDMKKIFCSNSQLEAKLLKLRSYPISTTIVIVQFRNATNAAHDQRRWLLADPDEFEETLSQQTVTLVVNGPNQIIKIECSGLGVLDSSEFKQIHHQAERRWREMMSLMGLRGDR